MYRVKQYLSIGKNISCLFEKFDEEDVENVDW